MTTDEQAYAFDNAIPAQLERLRTLEALFDEGSFRHLACVEPGWHVLEIGGGGGSVARWLAERVGPHGRVLATDLDTRYLAELTASNVEVRVHDVLADELPELRFDLIHLRLVLAWLPDPKAALARLVSALVPGGRLVAEEMDFGSVAPDPRMGEQGGALTRSLDAHLELLARRSALDSTYGRRLAGDLEDAGLRAVGCEGRATMWRSGEPGGRIWELTLAQLRDPLLAAGLIAADDIDDAIRACGDGLSCVSPLLMAAWGEKPG